MLTRWLTASTTDPDDFTGTGADETFNASFGRLQDNDALNGAGGNDTLNATIGADADSNIQAIIKDIEVLNLEVLSSTAVNGALISGAKNVNVTGGATLTYSSQDGEAFKVSGDNTGLTVTSKATDTTSDSITVSLGAGKAGTVTLGDAGNDVDYEVVNLVVAGAGSATITEADADNDQTDDGWAESTDKIIVTGAGDYTLKIASALLGENATAGSEANAVIDGSGHTGKLTVDLGTLTADNVSAKSWTGVDAIALGLETATDILSNVVSGTEVIVKSSSAGADTLTVKPNGTGTADTLTVTLNNPTAGSNVDIAGLTVDGFETVTVNSTGTDSSSTVVKNVIDDIAGTTSDKNLIFAGDKLITATGIEATFTNISVTNTTGSDLTVDAGGNLTYTGGTADDRLELDTVADITKDDNLNGGGGKDTLAISAELGTDFTDAQRAVIKGFEVLEYEGAQDITTDGAKTIDLTKLNGINELFINGDLTTDSDDTLTVKADDNFRLSLGGAVAATTNWVDLQITNAGAAGSNNTVTVALEKESGGAALSIDGFTIDNVENLTIEVKGVQATSDIITIDDIDGAQLQKLTVKSTAGVNTDGTAKTNETLVITSVETTLMNQFDATAATGAVKFQDVSAFIATGARLDGGAGADSLTGGVGADVITGGKGNDELNGDAGNDNINGGEGDDNINGDVGADVLTGGAGKDTFVFDNAESAEASMDTVTDFAAVAADQNYDTLDFAAVTVMTAGTAGDGVVTANLDVKGTIASGTGSEVVTATVTNGLVVLSGADKGAIDTLAEWVDVVEALLTTAFVDAGDTIGFKFGGDTYVYNVTTATGTAGNATDDVATSNLVKLVGVDATAIGTSAAAGTVLIA